ncbi:MAG: hypothetical protein IKP31_02850 [Lachnospiraceae bacterium]|nr:hypothetical protein [Lachnospiraceae bacterium]
MLTKIQNMYVSKEIYFLDSNVFAASGMPSSVCVSLNDGSVFGLDHEDVFSDIREDMLAVISEDTPAGQLMRYIIMRIRAALKVEPYANPYMLAKLRNTLNEELKNYNVMIHDSEEFNPVIGLMLNGVEQDVESVITSLLVWNGQRETGRVTDDFDMQYTRRLMGLMRYEEALELFLGELDKHDKRSMLYTELCMYIGEIYYHLDDRERSLNYYLECDVHYVSDVNDYYSRLGHSILDDGSGLRGNLIKMYYRCLLNPTYKKSIEDKYDRLAEQVEPLYDEYERKCVETGRDYLNLMK